MLSAYSPKSQDLLKRLNAFFEQHIYSMKRAIMPNSMLVAVPVIPGSY